MAKVHSTGFKAIDAEDNRFEKYRKDSPPKLRSWWDQSLRQDTVFSPPSFSEAKGFIIVDELPETEPRPKRASKPKEIQTQDRFAGLDFD